LGEAPKGIIIACYDISKTIVYANISRDGSEKARDVAKPILELKTTIWQSIIDLIFGIGCLFHLAESLGIDVDESIG